jgi:plasmid stabilization system protein ParE
MRHVVFVEESDFTAATERAERAEARAERLRAALELIAGFKGAFSMPFPETDPGYGAFAVVKSREAIAADTEEADRE